MTMTQGHALQSAVSSSTTHLRPGVRRTGRALRRLRRVGASTVATAATFPIPGSSAHGRRRFGRQSGSRAAMCNAPVYTQSMASPITRSSARDSTGDALGRAECPATVARCPVPNHRVRLPAARHLSRGASWMFMQDRPRSRSHLFPWEYNLLEVVKRRCSSVYGAAGYPGGVTQKCNKGDKTFAVVSLLQEPVSVLHAGSHGSSSSRTLLLHLPPPPPPTHTHTHHHLHPSFPTNAPHAIACVFFSAPPRCSHPEGIGTKRRESPLSRPTASRGVVPLFAVSFSTFASAPPLPHRRAACPDQRVHFHFAFRTTNMPRTRSPIFGVVDESVYETTLRTEASA